MNQAPAIVEPGSLGPVDSELLLASLSKPLIRLKEVSIAIDIALKPGILDWARPSTYVDEFARAVIECFPTYDALTDLRYELDLSLGAVVSHPQGRLIVHLGYACWLQQPHLPHLIESLSWAVHEQGLCPLVIVGAVRKLQLSSKFAPSISEFFECLEKVRLHLERRRSALNIIDNHWVDARDYMATKGKPYPELDDDPDFGSHED